MTHLFQFPQTDGKTMTTLQMQFIVIIMYDIYNVILACYSTENERDGFRYWNIVALAVSTTKISLLLRCQKPIHG